MQSTFDSGLLELLRLFEAKTGAHANDVITEGDMLLFLVQEGEMGKAIGKEGVNLARLRGALPAKRVEMVEDTSDLRVFIAKVLRGVDVKSVSVEENPKRVAVNVGRDSRGLAIGRNGANLKKLRLLLKKKFSVEEVRII